MRAAAALAAVAAAAAALARRAEQRGDGRARDVDADELPLAKVVEVSAAPEPEDVLWENLEVSRVRSIAYTAASLLVVLLLSTAEEARQKAKTKDFSQSSECEAEGSIYLYQEQKPPAVRQKISFLFDFELSTKKNKHFASTSRQPNGKSKIGDKIPFIDTI